MVWSSAARLREPLEEGHARRTRAALIGEDGQRTTLPANGATIGRSRGCDIVVDDAGVSRRHAEIRRGPDGWRLHDLGSTNGVSVDGVMLEVAHLLADGERIELGSTALRFEEP
jgi:pSer/pThr/pTyr-binding forkhead associated (FHA) protein